MKKVVLFDIDYTLFNPKKYRDILFQKLAEMPSISKPREEFVSLAEEVYLDMRETILYFNPDIYAEALEKRLGKPVDKEIVRQLAYDETILQEGLYEEIFSVLEALSETEDMTLGILSTGLGELQPKKIEKVKKYFDTEHIHVMPDKTTILPDLMIKYRNTNLFLIDDVLRILADAKKLNPSVKTIWIKRGRLFDKFPVEGFVPDKTVENLEGIVDFIKNN